MFWLALLFIAIVVLLIPTAYAGLIGAPYAPTPRRAITAAFRAVGVGAEDVVVDVGCGDGKALLEAAEQGARAVGFELSPIMWLVALMRVLGHKEARRRARVRYGNFYRQKLPPDTTVVFSFLMPERMGRVRDFLRRQKLPRARWFLSYAFPFKGIEPVRVIRTEKAGAVYVYDLRELVN